MRFNGKIARFLAFTVVRFFNGCSREPCGRSEGELRYIDGSHGHQDTFMWARCAADGKTDPARPETMSIAPLAARPSVDNNPVVTVTPTTAPSGYPATVISPGHAEWCNVAIQCHLGGGVTPNLHDKQQGGTPCHVDGFNNGEVYCDLADYIWIVVGVSQYPP